MTRAPDIRRIALVNFGGLGDEILFSPVLAELHRHLPEAELSLILESRSQAVVEVLPHLAEHHILELQGQPKWKSFAQLLLQLRSGRYDAVISAGSNPAIPVLLALSGIPVCIGFQTGLTSRLYLYAEAPLDRTAYAARMYFSLAETFCAHVLGPAYQPTSNPLPSLQPPSREDTQWAQTMLAKAGDARKILVHPGVSRVSVEKNILKSWPAEHWAALIAQLAVQDEQHVFLVGGPDDHDAVVAIRKALPEHLPQFHDLYGETERFGQLAALIEASDMLIAVDSSPMHVAVGYGRPVVAMFGPTDEKKLLPSGDPRFAAVRKDDLDCRPCLWDVRQTSCNKPLCLNVPVSAMAAAVRHMLGETVSGRP